MIASIKVNGAPSVDNAFTVTQPEDNNATDDATEGNPDNQSSNEQSTNTDTDTNTDTNTSSQTTDSNDKKGCKGVVGGAAIVATSIILGMGAIVKKKFFE